MTVLTTDNRRSYTGDGSATVFAFPVLFLDAADLKVALRIDDVESAPVLDADYTVSGAGHPSGGSVTFMVAPPAGATVVLFNDPAPTQTVDYQENGEFPAETHERALDKLTLLVQRLSARISRALVYDETVSTILSASEVLDRVSDAETARDAAQVASATASGHAGDALASANAAAASAASVDGPTLQAGIDGNTADITTLQASVSDNTMTIAAIETVPCGTVLWFAGSSAPTGYLKANGAVVSRTSYADLFAVIGTTYGSGDSSTTFALPDGRGVVPRGWDNGRGLDPGRVFGSYQADAYESHRHSLTLSGRNGSNSVSSSAGWSLESLSFPNAASIAANTSSVGAGSETRGKNIAYLACIKY